MRIEIGATIDIEEPSDEIRRYCIKELVISNPEYVKKERMGFWTGNTPRTINLYMNRGSKWVLPFGLLRQVLSMAEGATIRNVFSEPEYVDYGKAEVPLYDYQQEAVQGMLNAFYGILQSPAGSGKTQMGIALAVALGRKTLWLTHTKDLLNQSLSRAKEYIDPDLCGTITEGKVNIGKGITFATIQTMCRLDLQALRNEWDVIITDECHRVAGSPTAVTQFSKVLNSLSARHKYGLSATVHRADGLIKATFALVGQVAYSVPDEDVAGKIMKVHVEPKETGIGLNRCYLNTDGTINYQKMISYLAGQKDRNEKIVNNLVYNHDHYNLILSERVEHLETLYSLLPEELQQIAAVINGKTKKDYREQCIEDMRDGKKRYLFATYQLAKEGLDIPRLDRLFLTTPQKDYAVIVQSIGRVARTFEGKGQPIVYDYVDNTKGLIRAYKQRCTSYRKCGCVIKED